MTPQQIPDAVLAQHIAVLGKTGSGKTSTEKLAVEQVVDKGFRVCVLDTVKSDWWGVTSSADGKSAGLPFQILGGPHGHVALPSSAGAVIGKLVGEGQLPLSIIDMADFEPGGLQRFFIEFAPALLKHIHGVLYLVIEEAHEIAPKERAGFGGESMTIHWAKKLATAGRSKGIRLIVATQRTQSLHNALLGSCDTLIAHRLTAPADQDPVKKWLKSETDKETQQRVGESLSSLQTGTAWIVSGEAKVFERMHFQKFRTFDNTATPTGDEDRGAVVTAAVDKEELRKLVGKEIEQAEADKPETLRKEIDRLNAIISSASNEGAKSNDDDGSHFDAGYQDGKAEGFNLAFAMGIRALSDVFTGVNEVHAGLSVHIEELQKVGEKLTGIHHHLFEAIEGRAEGAPSLFDLPGAEWSKFDGKWTGVVNPIPESAASGQPDSLGAAISHEMKPAKEPENITENITERPRRAAGEPISPGEQSMLDVLAICHPQPITAEQWGLYSSRSSVSGPWRIAVRNLREAGLVDQNDSRYAATEAGRAAAGTTSAGITSDLGLWQHWAKRYRDDIGPPALDILTVLAKYSKHPLTAEQWGLLAKQSPVSGPWRIKVKSLTDWGVISKSGDRYGITPEGLVLCAGDIGHGSPSAALVEARVGKLSKAANDIYGELPGSSKEIAERLQRSAVSGPWRIAVKELTASGLVSVVAGVIQRKPEELT